MTPGPADVGFNTRQNNARIRESFEKDKANDLYHVDAGLRRKDVQYIITI